MFSFWERESFWNKPDVIVLGSGIVGLNAAIQLKKKEPSLKVVVVERGFLPYGASTRNAGFACFGSASELLDDLRKESEDEVMRRVEQRWKGLLKLRSLLGDQSICYEALGGFEIFTDNDSASFTECMERLPSLNKQLSNIVGAAETYATYDEGITEFGLGSVRHLVRNRHEGQLDTGRMMQALMACAASIGVKVFTGVNIKTIEHDEHGVVLITENGFRLGGGQLLVATNGFAARLFPELQVKPARAQVFITHPVQGLKLKGSFHYDEGYYYFRNVGDRILLGGGRNLDFEGETTTEMLLSGKIMSRLESFLNTVVCPYANPEIDLRWSGIMGVGDIKSPIVKRINPQMVCAVRMGGMGVAIGSLIGEQAADLLLEGR